MFVFLHRAYFTQRSDFRFQMAGFPSTLWLNDVLLYAYTMFSLSVYLLKSCFHILATVSNATMNTGVQIPLPHTDFGSLGHMCRSGIVRSYGSVTF